jgi:hypothetical protein
MKHMKNSILIVIVGFSFRMHAMDSESVKQAQRSHSKMIEALTFDATKGRYYYKPIFQRTEKGVYASMLLNFPKDQVCVDLGPAKLFWILRGRKLVKVFRDSIQDDLYVQYDKDQRKRFGNDDHLIPQAQQRVNDFKDLGSLEYDSEAGVYFHTKCFTAEKPATEKKVSSSESGSGDKLIYDSDNDVYFFCSYPAEDLAAAEAALKATDSRSGSGDDASSPESSESEKELSAEEWLRKVTILSFDREKRQYYYENLFEGERYQQGLKLCNEAPIAINRGPLHRLVTDLDYRGYDNFRRSHFWTFDHTHRSLEEKLGEYSYRDSYGGSLYYAKVFELTDK